MNYNSIKPGKIVIVLVGRFAGRKAVILRVFEEGTKDRKFGHILVAGLDKAPRRTLKKMSADKKEKRMKVTPFVKFINMQHVMPTRYNLDISEALNNAVGNDVDLTDVAAKKDLKKTLKEKLEARYKSQGDKKESGKSQATGAQYFFRKLRF